MLFFLAGGRGRILDTEVSHRSTIVTANAYSSSVFMIVVLHSPTTTTKYYSTGMGMIWVD